MESWRVVKEAERSLTLLQCSSPAFVAEATSAE
jgi:hypothetical protein